MQSSCMALLAAQMAALQIGVATVKDSIKFVYKGSLGIARFVQQLAGPAISNTKAAEKTKEVAEKFLPQAAQSLESKTEAFLALSHKDVVELIKWTSTKVTTDRFPLLLERLRVVCNTAEREAECRELTALLADRFERPVFNEFMGMLLYFYPEAMNWDHAGTRFGAALQEIVRTVPSPEIIAAYGNELARITMSIGPVKDPKDADAINYLVTGMLFRLQEPKPLTVSTDKMLHIFCNFLIDQLERYPKDEVSIQAKPHKPRDLEVLIDTILLFINNKKYFPDLFAPQSPLFARIEAGTKSVDPVVQAHFQQLYESIA